MRLGIIGTGRIAHRFVPEAAYVEGADIVSVYNPHKESAERYGEKWGIKAFYDGESTCQESDGKENQKSTKETVNSKSDKNHGLESFLNTVDAVYIATPHVTHAYYIRAALTRGKHVLCEKPMVLSEAEAKELFKLAENSGLVLMEGIKTAYCPGYKKLMEIAKSGVIGEPVYIESCFTKLESPDSRELTDTVTGGSFTELGTYVMLPVLSLFGLKAKFNHQSILREDNVDIFTKCNVLYDDGKIATATCGLGVKSEGRLVISGTKGYILVPAPWWKTSKFEVHFEKASEVIYYEEKFEGDGLRYEIKEFCDRVDQVERRHMNQESLQEPEQGAEQNSIQEKQGSEQSECELSSISICMAGLMQEFLEIRKNKR